MLCPSHYPRCRITSNTLCHIAALAAAADERGACGHVRPPRRRCRAGARLRPWSPTSEVEASPFSPLTGVWVVDRGRRMERRPQRPARGTRLRPMCCTFGCSVYHHCCGQLVVHSKHWIVTRCRARGRHYGRRWSCCACFSFAAVYLFVFESVTMTN
jgi:hypothetical protein